jgi:glycosyltransferase involved in cell wall biosynthesis
MFAPKKITHAQGMKVLASVDKIMTVSNYMGRTITKRFTKAKSLVKTVYSGFNINTYIPSWTPEAQSIREKLHKKYGIEGKKVILFVGRLSDKKGPHVLIRSMKQILMQHKDAVLVIVGGKWFSDNTVDDYVRSLYRLARPYGKKIIFTKYIPNDQMPHHYLMADVFVCSSQWQEPLARVHYEAMGAGLPIITTNRGGNPEVIKHRNNGLVVKGYTKPSAFAIDINYMLSNPTEAMRMAKNGRNFVKSNFTFEHVAKRLNAVYTKAYQKRAKPSSERLKGATST